MHQRRAIWTHSCEGAYNLEGKRCSIWFFIIFMFATFMLGVCWRNERDLVWKRAIDRFTIFPWKVLWQKVEKRLTAWQESKKSGFGADISKDWNNASLKMFEFYYHLIKFLRKWMRFNWKHCVTISSSTLEWKLPNIFVS